MSPFLAIIGIAKAFEEGFKFLCTPEGQLLCQLSRTNFVEFDKRFKAAIGWIEIQLKKEIS